MAISFVQRSSEWTATTPATSGSFSTTSTNTLIGWLRDSTSSATSSGNPQCSSLTNFANINGVSGSPGTGSFSLAYQQNIPGGTSTYTVSSDSGDTVRGELFEYSGINSISSDSYKIVSGPGSGGTITGNSVTVPVGSQLLAILTKYNGSTETIGSASGALATDFNGILFTTAFPMSVARWDGTGASITPTWTAGSAGDGYYIVQQVIISRISYVKMYANGAFQASRFIEGAIT